MNFTFKPFEEILKCDSPVPPSSSPPPLLLRQKELLLSESATYFRPWRGFVHARARIVSTHLSSSIDKMSNWTPYQFQTIVFWCSVPIWDRVIIILIIITLPECRVNHTRCVPITISVECTRSTQHIVVTLWLWLWISAFNTQIYVRRSLTESPT